MVATAAAATTRLTEIQAAAAAYRTKAAAYRFRQVDLGCCWLQDRKRFNESEECYLQLQRAGEEAAHCGAAARRRRGGRPSPRWEIWWREGGRRRVREGEREVDGAGEVAAAATARGEVAARARGPATARFGLFR